MEVMYSSPYRYFYHRSAIIYMSVKINEWIFYNRSRNRIWLNIDKTWPVGNENIEIMNSLIILG